MEQSTEMIKLKATNFFPYLKKNGSYLGVTYLEYLSFMKIVMSKICEYMGADFTMEDTPDGMLWTVKKK
jgi:hypothetical protein